MKKAIASCLLLVTVACGGGSTVTGPTTSSETATAPAASAPVQAPSVVEQPTPDGFDRWFSDNAGFAVKNTGGRARSVYAYTTGFDNQQLVLASKQALVAGGDTFAGSFGAQCVQLDLSTESVGGRPDIGFAYFDKQGHVITTENRDAKIAECRTCVPEYTTRTVVTYEGEGCRRVKVTTTYTKNSCSKDETSVAVRTSDPVPVFVTKGYFQVDSLSNAGTLYSIVDSGLPGILKIWKSNLNLPAGNNLGIRYEHPINNETLTLWYLVEKIGSAKATCTTPTATWHGKVSFVCVKINTCEQNQ